MYEVDTPVPGEQQGGSAESSCRMELSMSRINTPSSRSHGEAVRLGMVASTSAKTLTHPLNGRSAWMPAVPVED